MNTRVLYYEARFISNEFFLIDIIKRRKQIFYISEKIIYVHVHVCAICKYTDNLEL